MMITSSKLAFMAEVWAILFLMLLIHSLNGYSLFPTKFFLSFSTKQTSNSNSNSQLYSTGDSIGINPESLKARLLGDRARPISVELVTKQIDFDNIDNNFHKRDDDWGCMKNCGACCMLGPLDWRPQLKNDLSEQEYELYVSMIGNDNWCIYFDKEKRQCGQFETRPNFCRVEKKRYMQTYELQEEEYTDFLRFCCTESIIDAYGKVSVEEYKYARLMDMISHEPDGFDPNDEKYWESISSNNAGEKELSYKEIIIDPRNRPEHEEDDFVGGEELEEEEEAVEKERAGKDGLLF